MQHAVIQLIGKKERMLGELEFYKEKVEILEEIIKGLDLSIQVFDPSFDIKTIKTIKYRVKYNHFTGNETYKMTLDILREAKDYLSTHKVTVAIMNNIFHGL